MVGTGRESGGLFRQVHRLFRLGTMVGLTDGQLLDQLVTERGEESEAAFEELMHRHGPMVLRVCRGMLGDRPSADDAFQATFLVLAERAHSIRRRESLSTKGFVQSRGIPVFPGARNQIVMASPTTVKGTVVDAETGRPISDFSLVEGTVGNDGNSLIWQRNGAVDERAKKTPGSFEFTFSYQVHRLRVRVEAEGYLSEDSELFAQDGSVHEFSFRLTKADRIRGTVVNHDALRRFPGPKLLLAPTRVLPPLLTPPRSPRRS
jgi:hypothetical protein